MALEKLAAPTDYTTKQVHAYYRESKSYLEGPLSGTCHFGFTLEGEQFDLEEALHAMEMKLGERLNLLPGSIVLDAGCGFGRVATTLNREFNLEVIGLDLIHERLREANRYTHEHGVSDNISMLQGNYCVLPLANESIDGAYFMETLVHAPSYEDALAEMYRVLKPGAPLALFEYSIPDMETVSPLRRIISKHMIDRTGMASIEHFVHGRFPEILDNANFKDVQVEEVSKQVAPMWRWMFYKALREGIPNLIRDRRKDRTNFVASLMLWPYRKQLGYNIVTARKPTI